MLQLVRLEYKRPITELGFFFTFFIVIISPRSLLLMSVILLLAGVHNR